MSPVLPYPFPSSPSVTAVMRGNRKIGTKPEQRLRSHLHALGFRFRKAHLISLPGLKVRPDLVFTRRRVAVFVDGCFWHSCPIHGNAPRTNPAYWGPKLTRNIERDQLVTQALSAAGWRVVRVWEHASTEDSALAVMAALRDAPAGPTPVQLAPGAEGSLG